MMMKKWKSFYLNRVYPRFEVQATVDLQGENLLLFHKIENISLGGLSLFAPEPEPVGSVVEIVINFPEDDSEILVQGEVVWISENPCCLIGVRFLNLTGWNRERLNRFIFESVRIPNRHVEIDGLEDDDINPSH